MTPLLKTSFILGFATTLSNAAPIGINFGAGRTDASLLATDSAGVIAQTNWNNLTGATGGPTILNDSSGTATATSITWATAEEWSLGDVPADPNGTLLNGWIGSQAVTDPLSSVTLTGIPFETYDLYIYLAHDRATEDVALTEANAAFSPFLAHEDDTDILTPVVFSQQTLTANGDDTQSGNFVKFTNLTQADLTLFLDPAGSVGTAERGAINGIQIIEIIAGDGDGDGLDDTWESSFGLDPSDNGLNPNNNGVAGNPDNGADGDPDNDGSTNAEEQTRQTFPNDEDTDNDTLLDGVESNDGIYLNDTMTGTNPLRVDSDGDTLNDNVENNSGTFVDETKTGTNPNKADTDGDDLTDDWEITNALDPFDDGSTDPKNGSAGDPDTDDSDNAEEQTRGTDPQVGDTDGDNLLDGVETGNGNYVDENATGTNPLNPDTDGDSLQDDIENDNGTFVSAANPGTNPNLADTDGDGFSDGWEANNGRHPLSPNDNAATDGAIGLNFGAGRINAELLATDSAGVVPQANWNNLATSVGDNTELNDDQGSGSGATVSWATDEEWSIGGPGADANGTLLNGWISSNVADPASTVDVSDIPYRNYDLIIYMNHDRDFEDVLISEANEAFPAFLAHENDTDILNPVTFAQQEVTAEGDATQSGNFFVIPNLTGQTLNLLLGPAGEAGSADRGAVTGIQIINRGPSSGLQITSIIPNPEAGTVTITWNSVNGRSYAIDAGPSPDLAAADEIDDFGATGDVSTYTESFIDFTATTKRFYRVREVTE
ncbi:MAG: hypothetical protein ACI8UZ_001715 [Akkermansiaceae bacterium]|jgi:hypothetical protein